MKKIIIVLFLLGLVTPASHLSFISAGYAWAKPINVVTTTADLKSVVEFIGGDHVKVYSLGKGKQNYHFLSAKPSYMVKAKKADLFIRNGLELEIGYESLILEGSRNPNIQVGRDGHLDASEGVHALDVPHHVDRSMGDIHASGNPHYWIDPLNMKIVARSITDKLIQIDPQQRSYFEDNLYEFDRKIDQKMREWKRMLRAYQGEKLVTYHQSWSYFAKRFGFEVVDELEPKPGIAPSPTHLQDIADVVLNQEVRVILMENIYKRKAADFVADRTGATVVVSPISVGGQKGVDDYFQLMDVIVQSVKEGFATFGDNNG